MKRYLALSSKAQRRVRAWSAVAFGSGALVAGWALIEHSPTGAQLGAAVSVLGAFGAFLADHAISEISHCALCLRPRAQVRKLVAGELGAVCEGCVGESLRMLANAKPSTNDWLLAVLGALTADSPDDMSTPFLLAGAARARDVATRRAWTMRALRLQNMTATVQLIESAPSEERNAVDWLNLGVAYWTLCREQDAIEATVKAEGCAEESSRPFILNNLACYGAMLAVNPEPASFDQWLADVREARRLCELDKEPAATRELRASTWENEAFLLWKKGEPAAALAAVDTANEIRPTPRNGILRAKLLEASEPSLARALALAALPTCKPGTRYLRDVNALLERLPALPSAPESPGNG